MKKYLLAVLGILCLYSCSDNSRNYTGEFKNINKKAFAREITIHHVNGDKFRISSLGGLMIEEGIRKGSRITAMFKDENMIKAYGRMPDSSKVFYDFSQDYNQITVSSEDMNDVETYIRTK